MSLTPRCDELESQYVGKRRGHEECDRVYMLARDLEHRLSEELRNAEEMRLAARGWITEAETMRNAAADLSADVTRLTQERDDLKAQYDSLNEHNAEMVTALQNPEFQGWLRDWFGESFANLPERDLRNMRTAWSAGRHSMDAYAEQLQRTATAFLKRAVLCRKPEDFDRLMDSDELFDLRGSLSKNSTPSGVGIDGHEPGKADSTHHTARNCGTTAGESTDRESGASQPEGTGVLGVRTDKPTLAELQEILRPKSQGRCESAMTERFDVGGCKCPTYAGNLGPCLTWQQARASDHCVYCDHSLGCHRTLSAMMFGTSTPSQGNSA